MSRIPCGKVSYPGLDYIEGSRSAEGKLQVLEQKASS